MMFSIRLGFIWFSVCPPDMRVSAGFFIQGSTVLFWRAGIGHEKCVRQGANRSDTTWYREDLQRSRAHFLVAEAAAMNKSVLPQETIGGEEEYEGVWTHPHQRRRRPRRGRDLGSLWRWR
jgi:hypothetical protein